jgi:hypothetical protein
MAQPLRLLPGEDHDLVVRFQGSWCVWTGAMRLESQEILGLQYNDRCSRQSGYGG